ncbi:hypothetical protein [Marinomonas sp.]
MKIIEPKSDEVKKALILTKEEALEAIKTLQEQIEMGLDKLQLVIEYDE